MEWKSHSTGIVFICCIFHFILQTLPDSLESYILDGSIQVEFCTSQSWVFTWSMICVIFKRVHLKFILQHTGIWSATVWGPTTYVVTWQCLLQHSYHCTFIPARENLACSSKKLFSFLFTFLKTGINWNHTIWGVSVLCMLWNLK
jgi:hypothetical protein